MNQKGPFIKLEGKNMKMLASPSYVLKDFVPKEGYPKCCPYHESVLDYVVNWWKKFPNCCKEHETMVSSGYIKKEDYNYVPEKIITCYAYFEYHLSQKINEDNWFTDIKHYLEHLSFSFGHPAIGFAQLQHLIEFHLHNHKPTDWTFPEERRSALIAYLTKKVETKKNDTDLNLLYSIYQKWLKTVPDIHYFSYLKQTTTAKAPMNLFLYDTDYNPYTGMTSSQVKTTVELVKSLFDLTKQVLSQIDTVQMVKDKVISDAQLFKINLINENHRIKQLKLVQEYNKSEAKYVKIIKRWLANEKVFFDEITPELAKLPVPSVKPNPHSYSRKTDEEILNNIDKSSFMTLKIFNDICFGRLKPWTFDNSRITKLSPSVREAAKMVIESPDDLHKKLKTLLAEYPEFDYVLTNKPTFSSIQTPPYSFIHTDANDIATKYYKEIIDAEAIRYYNEVLVNPLIVDQEKDIPYQIGNKVLGALKDLICKTKEEMQSLQSKQETKDCDDLSMYVMDYLHKNLLTLFFSIQEQYELYLIDKFHNLSEFYFYIFNIQSIDFKLIQTSTKEEVDNTIISSTKTRDKVKELNSQKKIAYEKLAFFKGKNIQKQEIMSENDFERLLNLTYELIETERVPFIAPKLSQIGLSNAMIRYTFYDIHKSLYGTKSIRFYWIEFIHEVFEQFNGSELITTKTKFSTKPSNYQQDINSMLG